MRSMGSLIYLGSLRWIDLWDLWYIWDLWDIWDDWNICKWDLWYENKIFVINKILEINEITQINKIIEIGFSPNKLPFWWIAYNSVCFHHTFPQQCHYKLVCPLQHFFQYILFDKPESKEHWKIKLLKSKILTRGHWLMRFLGPQETVLLEKNTNWVLI